LEIRRLKNRKLSVLSNGLFGLVVAQIGLGIATWVAKYNWPSWFANWSWTAGNVIQEKSLPQAITVTAHVAMGSLILAGAVAISVFVFRLYNPWASEVPDGGSSKSKPTSPRLNSFMAEGMA
jgi:heme a synthase